MKMTSPRPYVGRSRRPSPCSSIGAADHVVGRRCPAGWCMHTQSYTFCGVMLVLVTAVALLFCVFTLNNEVADLKALLSERQEASHKEIRIRRAANLGVEATVATLSKATADLRTQLSVQAAKLRELQMQIHKYDNSGIGAASSFNMLDSGQTALQLPDASPSERPEQPHGVTRSSGPLGGTLADAGATASQKLCENITSIGTQYLLPGFEDQQWIASGLDCATLEPANQRICLDGVVPAEGTAVPQTCVVYDFPGPNSNAFAEVCSLSRQHAVHVSMNATAADPPHRTRHYATNFPFPPA